MDLRDAYRILELPYGSDYSACHNRYKELALRLHPDLKQHLTAVELAEAHDALVQVNQAWRVLRSAFGNKKTTGVVPVPEWKQISSSKGRTTSASSSAAGYPGAINDYARARAVPETDDITSELWENWSAGELFNIAIDMINSGRSSRVKLLPTKLIDLLVDKLQSTSSKTRNTAIKVLIAFGASVAPILIEFMQDGRGYVRANAVYGLGELRYRPAVHVIIERLNDTNLKVRQRAARALGLLGDRVAIEPLMYHILNERFKIVVWTAALALLQLVEDDANEEELKAILRKLIFQLGTPNSSRQL